MERRVIVVCCVVGFLGLLSAAAGFAAEATRVKANQVEYFTRDDCIFPRSPARGLGITAAFSLLIAEVIIYYETVCVCCVKGPRQSNSNWTLVLIICSVVSGLTSVIAFLLLIIGATLNEPLHDYHLYPIDYDCYVIKPGVFAGGSVLSLASVVLEIIYYLTLTKVKNTNNPFTAPAVHPIPGGNIAMVHPQIPPQAHLCA